MTIPVFVASGADATINGPGGGGTGSLPAPAGVVADDLLLCVMFIAASSGASATPPTGFNPVNSVAAGLFNAGVYIYYKFAGSSEPANYAVSTTGGNGGRGKMYAYRGVGQSAPINAQAASAAQSGVTSITGPSVTTTAADCLYLMLAMEYNGRTPTLSATSGGTSRGGSTTAGMVFLLTDEGKATAGAVNGETQGSSISGDFYAVSIALAPVPVAPTLGGGVTQDDATAAGSLSTSASDLSGGPTLDALAAAGTLSNQPGRIVTGQFRSPLTGLLMPNQAITWCSALRASDGLQVAVLTGQQTSGGAVLTIDHGALLPGAGYLLVAYVGTQVYGAEYYVAGAAP